MKKAMMLGMLMVAVVTMASTSFATSAASIKGVYNFQVAGIDNQYGYYSGSTWVQAQVSSCPAKQVCFSQAFPRLTYGTISFDGVGHATFLTVGNVNNAGSNLVPGTVLPYSVSGYNGAIGSSTNGAYLTLGSFNAAGVATVVTIRTANGTNPSTGVATLQ